MTEIKTTEDYEQVITIPENEVKAFVEETLRKAGVEKGSQDCMWITFINEDNESAFKPRKPCKIEVLIKGTRTHTRNTP